METPLRLFVSLAGDGAGERGCQASVALRQGAQAMAGQGRALQTLQQGHDVMTRLLSPSPQDTSLSSAAASAEGCIAGLDTAP